ncbi:hypothetical protein [Eoetvoesiella caeni]
MANMVTSIVMQLVDRVTSPVRRIQQSLSRMSQRSGLDRLGRAARQVGVQMGFAVQQAKVLAIRAAAIGAAAAAGAWGVSRLVGRVTEAGNAIKESSERLGVGSTWLQEWLYVGRQFGVQNDAMVDGLKELGLRADEFIMTAGGPAAEAFKRLGIDHKDLRKTKGNTEAMFDLVMDRLRGVTNFAARQRLVDEIFGGSGGEQMAAMVSMTTEEIEKMKRAAQDSGSIFTEEQIEQSREYTRQMGNFGLRLTGIQNTIVGGLLPGINQWLERLDLWVQKNKAMIRVKVEDALTRIWNALKLVGGAVSWVADRVGGFGNLLIGIAGIMAGKFVLSVGMAAWSLGVFAKDALVFSITGLARLGRGLLVAGSRLAVFAARGVAMAAMSLVSLSRGLIGLAARAVPAAIMGIRAMSLALLTTPVGWIITGITAVAGIAFLLYKNWDGVAAWFGQMWEGVKRFFSQSPGQIARQLVSFSPAVLIYRNWEGITAWFGKMWEGVKTFFTQGIGNIAKDLLGFDPAQLLRVGVNKVFDLLEPGALTDTGSKWIGGLWDGIKARWSQLTAWLRTSVADLTSWMPDWAKERLGIGSMAAPAAGGSPRAALGAPVATPGSVPTLAGQRSQVDVGGQLKIKIDSEGRARVQEARSRGGMDFDVDAGVLGVAG